MYKAILWDNDGILVNTEKWYFEATKIVMEEEGYSLTLDIYRDTFLKNNTGAWHLLNNTSADYIMRLRIKRNKIYSSFLQTKNIVNKGVSDILDSVNGKYNMGIVTSSRKDHFDIIHSRTNLLKYFKFIITSDDFTCSKPSPEPYLLGIKKTGYNASECIAIEDSERGVVSAKKANLFCIAIPNEMTNSGDFSKADIIINDLKEIPQYLENLSKSNN